MGEGVCYHLIMNLSASWVSVLSELSINLAAGWFATAIIVPIAFSMFRPINRYTLAGNLILGIMATLVAVKLRTLI